MSMEQAILELAAAMREQAAAQRESNEVQRATSAGYEKAVMAYGAAVTQGGAGQDPIDTKAAELAEATATRAAAAKTAAAKDAAKNKAGDAELAQAVQKVEDDAKAEKAGATAGDAVQLDYAKDVRPVLLAAIKKAGKDEVQKLIGTFGVDKADKVPADKLGKLLDEAQKLAA